MDCLFKEAKRLHRVGLGILWLCPNSKIPTEEMKGWATGPRLSWDVLEKAYRPGMNVGVRPGSASKLRGGYLACIDIDIKSNDPKHHLEAKWALKEFLKAYPHQGEFPEVRSGRGNGCKHYYFVSPKPFQTFNVAGSDEMAEYYGPSKKPSKLELSKISQALIKSGTRLGKAWEIALYSNGRQMVLPPSIHPDSGKEYEWIRPLSDDLPLLNIKSPEKENHSLMKNEGSLFQIVPVDLGWLEISKEVRDGIRSGLGVIDRSGFLLRAVSALRSAGLERDEILSVLTDPKNFISECAYEHAQTANRQRAGLWIDRYTFKKVEAESSVEEIFHVKSPPPKRLTHEEMKAQHEEFAQDWDWESEILRTNRGVPLNRVQNVVHILKNSISPNLVERDLFAYRDTFSCDTPWNAHKGDVVSDDHVAMIQYWLGENYRFEPSINTISNALIVIAHQSSYDPMKQFLDEIPEWDKKSRLNSWLLDHFEAQGDPNYLAQVFRKWMVAMVMRVYHPGAKFDWMPIFEGAQGIGKSSFGRLLVGDQYFLDWLPNLNDKDSALSLQGMWGVEMGELSQFRKNELENIKAFITRTNDKLRPPYGKRLIESPRRCVFFGTTNRENYLIDDTGNRRFKPVMVGKLDFINLKRDRLQLFAEAKFLFQNRIETEFSLDLDGDAKIYERKIQNEKMVEDDSHSMEQAMRSFIQKIQVEKINFPLERFKILDLFGGVGPFANWKGDNRNTQFASKMLKRLGAESRMIKGLKYWKVSGLT